MWDDDDEWERTVSVLQDEKNALEDELRRLYGWGRKDMMKTVDSLIGRQTEASPDVQWQ